MKGASFAAAVRDVQAGQKGPNQSPSNFFRSASWPPARDEEMAERSRVFRDPAVVGGSLKIARQICRRRQAGELEFAADLVAGELVLAFRGADELGDGEDLGGSAFGPG